MAKTIYIAKSGAKHAPTLPGDAVTRTFGIFGMKDSGKTTAARVLVEGVCKIGGHAVVIDPVGVWWGATRAGTGPGIQGVVIGGEHGDVPLEETGGKLVAELVLARQYPLVVIDTNLLRKGARHRFLADLLEEVYHRNRKPLMVVFEEADQTLPQAPKSMDPTLGRVLGAAEDIVKLGRSRGLGAALISQRFATVNKNVTEQIESLILLRIIGPNDRKAVKAWIESNGEAEVTAKVMDSMASLHQGEGWLYSPGWLRLLERVRMRASRTLDSSATPTDEEAIEQDAAKRAPVSLETLRTQMQESVERAKENDPAELRKRLVQLERELREAQENVVEAEPKEIKIVVPDRALVAELSEMVASLEAGVDELRAEREALAAANDETMKAVRAVLSVWDARIKAADDALGDARALLDTTGALPSGGIRAHEVVAQVAARAGIEVAAPPRQSPPRQAPPPTPIDGELTGPQQRVINACAWLEAVGFPTPSKQQVGFIAGYRVGKKVGGTYGNILGQLRAAALVEYVATDLRLTDAGAAQASDPGIPRTTDGLQQAVYARLSGVERRVLEAVVSVYPNPATKQDIGAAAGYTVGEKVGGTFGNILGKLRTLGLIDYPAPGYVVAAAIMFVV